MSDGDGDADVVAALRQQLEDAAFKLKAGEAVFFPGGWLSDPNSLVALRWFDHLLKEYEKGKQNEQQ